MPEYPQCDAMLYSAQTDVERQCSNTAAARVTEDGEVRYYCRAHTKLAQEFLKQARVNAIRWSSVIQLTANADA